MASGNRKILVRFDYRWLSLCSKPRLGILRVSQQDGKGWCKMIAWPNKLEEGFKAARNEVRKKSPSAHAGH